MIPAAYIALSCLSASALCAHVGDTRVPSAYYENDAVEFYNETPYDEDKEFIDNQDDLVESEEKEDPFASFMHILELRLNKKLAEKLNEFTNHVQSAFAACVPQVCDISKQLDMWNSPTCCSGL